MLKMVKIQVKNINRGEHVDLCCIHVTGVSVSYRNAMMLWSWIGDLTMYQRLFYHMWMVCALVCRELELTVWVM